MSINKHIKCDQNGNSSNLAILGGQPVRNRPMPPRLAINENEIQMVNQVFEHYGKSDMDPGYQGYFEEQYTQAFVQFMGGGYADAVATGTAALYTAISALELPQGSEVLVSPITDPGSLSAIILNGLKPRLMDSESNSYNVGINQFLERISSNTSAVMIVHASGQSITDIEKIVREAAKRDIKVIEDCSQAHGARVNGKCVGTFGDISAFSTMYRKASVTGGCGGVIFTKNQKLFHKAEAYADRGKPKWIENFDDKNPAHFLFPALNLHTDEISCAIGFASLSRLSDTIQSRYDFVYELSQLISQNSNVCTSYPIKKGDSPFFHPIIVDCEKIKCSKEEFAKAIHMEGIGLNPHYLYVVCEWPWINPYLADNYVCHNAISIRNRSFNLFVNENYRLQEAKDILDAIMKVETYYCK